MSIFSKPHFWISQLSALRRWGLAIILYRCNSKSSQSFFKKSSETSKALVLIFPGVGGQHTQFYWMIQRILQKCSVDILYIQPKWGETLDSNTQDVQSYLSQILSSPYDRYVAIGHSRGGLLAKHVLDQIPCNKERLLCTLATPWKAPIPNSQVSSGLRGWIYKKNYVPYLSKIFRWGEAGTIELFQTYTKPIYETCAIASLFDPIIGDPIYQCPEESPSSCQLASHLSLPLDRMAIDYLVDIIKKNTEALDKRPIA